MVRMVEFVLVFVRIERSCGKFEKGEERFSVNLLPVGRDCRFESKKTPSGCSSDDGVVAGDVLIALGGDEVLILVDSSMLE